MGSVAKINIGAEFSGAFTGHHAAKTTSQLGELEKTGGAAEWGSEEIHNRNTDDKASRYSL